MEGQRGTANSDGERTGGAGERTGGCDWDSGRSMRRKGARWRHRMEETHERKREQRERHEHSRTIAHAAEVVSPSAERARRETERRRANSSTQMHIHQTSGGTSARWAETAGRNAAKAEQRRGVCRGRRRARKRSSECDRRALLWLKRVSPLLYGACWFSRKGTRQRGIRITSSAPESVERETRESREIGSGRESESENTRTQSTG